MLKLSKHIYFLQGVFMSKKYTNYSSEFKFKVALEALKGKKATAKLCREFHLAASQIYA